MALPAMYPVQQADPVAWFRHLLHLFLPDSLLELKCTWNINIRPVLPPRLKDSDHVVRLPHDNPGVPLPPYTTVPSEN